MASPRKPFLDFFAHAKDARWDSSIRVLRHKHGNDGYATYFCLLEMICGEDGLALNLSSPLALEVAVVDCGLRDSVQFLEILNNCIDLGLFDKQLWESERVVYSHELCQRRARAMEEREKTASRVRRHRAAKATLWGEEDLMSTVDGVGGKEHPYSVNAYVKKKFRFKCVYCGSSKKLEVDHLFPVSKGGSEDLENLVCACKSCNSSKGDRTPDEAQMRFVDKLAECQWEEWSKTVTLQVTAM